MSAFRSKRSQPLRINSKTKYNCISTDAGYCLCILHVYLVAQYHLSILLVYLMAQHYSSILQTTRISKLDKADILEMTVEYAHRINTDGKLLACSLPHEHDVTCQYRACTGPMLPTSDQYRPGTGN